MQRVLPKHIAIIMDGNGRWAKKRFLPRIAGHKAGVAATKRIVKHCAHLNIPVLSLFTFSSENWQRAPEEVHGLMELFLISLEQEVSMLSENNIQLRFIGDREKFNLHLRKKIDEVERMMQNNTGLILLIAADYGGQWDIWQATQKLAYKIEAGELSAAALTPDHICQHLSFADLPNPDLFIRSGGEIRISNFMLWQLAYAELYFSELLWPDFSESEFDKALVDFAQRQRHFGRTPAASLRNKEC